MFDDEFSKWVATFEDKVPQNDGDHANAWVPVWEASRPADSSAPRPDKTTDPGQTPFHGS